jgi:predicted transcriptional regulator
MTEIEHSKALLGLTADIVAAHVKNNQVATTALPGLIEQVFAALRDAGRAAAPAPAPARVEPERQSPVVSAKKSVFADYIICLEDGRKLKTLKRHLRSTYDLTPEQYREKWGLAADYPMVAPNYAEHRSALAKQAGLGRKPAAAKPAAPQLDLTPPPAPRPAPVQPPAPAVSVAPPQEHPRESRSEHTAASVFAKFPRAQEPAAPAPAPADARKSTRKPFSKQLARNMRP